MSNERFKVQVAATFVARSQSSALLTDYVSYLGVFLRTDSPPPIMELLRIEFVLPPSSAKVVMHGMVTKLVTPQKHAVPGVEIAFFAKLGESGRLWDQFVGYVREKYPASVERSVRLAVDATDQTRRAHPRHVPGSPLTIVSTECSGALGIGDISSGGMFLRTEETFAVGTDLRVTLMNPRTAARFPLDCVIRRRVSGASPGLGLEFCNMNDAKRSELTKFLRAADPGELVQAHCEEVLVPYAPQMMNTLSGPGSFGGRGSIAPSEDSWKTLDDGWPSV